jgi:orotidine-5'-phosphate decarboxylase
MNSLSVPHTYRLILALDVPGKTAALDIVRRLQPLGLNHVKVGMSLFYEAGIGLVEELRHLGLDVFVDLKLHDIPATVARTVDVLVRGGASFLNVHALGGQDMMRRAAEQARLSAEQAGLPQPTVIAVTLLTSHSPETLKNDLHIHTPLEDHVVHLARMAQVCGLQGVVCSALEAQRLHTELGPDFLKVTPGIRPAFYTTQDDQHRVLTPAKALGQGATHLVIGRPVYGASDMETAFIKTLQEMSAVPTTR